MQFACCRQDFTRWYGWYDVYRDSTSPAVLILLSQCNVTCTQPGHIQIYLMHIHVTVLPFIVFA